MLDANVLIGYLDGADVHHVAAEALLVAAVDDGFAVNALTLAEVLVAPARDGLLDAVTAVLRDLEVETLPFPAHMAVRLAQLRADTGLTMPDCGVLLSTEDAGARVASFDARLAQAAADRGLSVLSE